MCHTKGVGTAKVECDDDVFIATVDGHVPVVDAGENPWTVTIDINTVPVQFKIDTGADVSVISELTFQGLSRVDLQPTRRSLTGPSQLPLPVCGQSTSLLEHGNKEVEEEKIFVVKGLKTALIGCPAIEALSLVARVNSVDNLKQKFATQYANLEGAVEKEISPRSYQVSTPYGPLQRNRLHLRPIPNSPTFVVDNHYEDIPEQEFIPPSLSEVTTT